MARMRRRLLHMFGDVVLGIPHEDFESTLAALKQKRGVQLDIELNERDLNELVQSYKQVGGISWLRIRSRRAN